MVNLIAKIWDLIRSNSLVLAIDIKSKEVKMHLTSKSRCKEDCGNFFSVSKMINLTFYFIFVITYSTCFTKTITSSNMKRDMDSNTKCITVAYASCFDSESLDSFFACTRQMLSDCQESLPQSGGQSLTTCDIEDVQDTARMCFNQEHCRDIIFNYIQCKDQGNVNGRQPATFEVDHGFSFPLIK